MIVQVNTGRSIDGSAKQNAYIESVVRDSLSPFLSRITRVEVHLTDENSAEKEGGDDKSCVIEARLGGMKPITVSGLGSSVDHALDDATDKMRTKLHRTLDRLKDHKGRLSFAGDQSWPTDEKE